MFVLLTNAACAKYVSASDSFLETTEEFSRIETNRIFRGKNHLMIHN